MNHFKFQGRALALAPYIALAAAPGFAEEARATLSGTITDPSDSSVAGPQVHSTNTETGIASSTQTNGLGQYRLLFINPGTYNVTVEMPGFRTFMRDGIVLTLGEAGTPDVAMQPAFSLRTASSLYNAVCGTAGGSSRSSRWCRTRVFGNQ